MSFPLIVDAKDVEFFASLPDLPENFTAGQKRPAMVDSKWYRTENQKQVGSCNGVAWTGVLERCHYAATGQIVQLSKMWMYLMAQKVGGLLGSDRGSRPSDGAKVARDIGCPPEDLVGYTGRYPDKNERLKIMRADLEEKAEPYRAAKIWGKPRNLDEWMDVIGLSGGGWVYGVVWYQGLIPGDRIVREFNPNGKRVLGMHAMCSLGYDGDVIGAENSHADGPYKILPRAAEQMLAHSQTMMCGATPTLDARPVDWLKDSPWL